MTSSAKGQMASVHLSRGFTPGLSDSQVHGLSSGAEKLPPTVWPCVCFDMAIKQRRVFTLLNSWGKNQKETYF